MKAEDIPKVKPISVDVVNVIIICPFCNQKHIHGSCGGSNYAGPRVAHCKDGVDREYEILDAQIKEEKE